ncbi:hypothetical protein DXA95_11485 [Odoribacter sp. OF09-27XD]|nr:hypothetical protein DXA95_11485 [Odoribacter sp. OF09-27XD]
MGLCRIGCDNMFNMEKKINRRENNEDVARKVVLFPEIPGIPDIKVKTKNLRRRIVAILIGREKTMKINLVLIIQGRREVLGRSLNPVINADRE